MCLKAVQNLFENTIFLSLLSGLLTQYCFLFLPRKRQLMVQENGEEHLNEYQLFHGTAPNVVDAICAENFDFRLSGAHGTAMGHGKSKVRLFNGTKFVVNPDSPLRR